MAVTVVLGKLPSPKKAAASLNYCGDESSGCIHYRVPSWLWEALPEVSLISAAVCSFQGFTALSALVIILALFAYPHPSYR